MKDGYWNTLCLPFDVIDSDASIENVASGGPDGKTFTGTPLEGAVVMELDVESTHDGHVTGFDASDGTLYLFFSEATAIEAGKPYIIKWGTPDPGAPVNPIVDPTFTGVTITTTGMFPIESRDGTVSFRGTYNTLNIAGENRSLLFLGDENKLYYPNAAMSINAFRTYFELNGITAGDLPANNVKMFFGDEETTSIHNSQFIIHNEAGAWYTLDGRKVNAPSLEEGRGGLTRGIYIHNGKKIVVK